MASEKAKSTSKKTPPSTLQPVKSGQGNALSKPVQPDDVLAAIVGSDPLPRTQLTVKIWDYIKLHKLQDSKNKRQINADSKLKELFGGKDHVTMFELTKMVSVHLKK
jgi:chromatin remodeling complex protein RSC6